MARLIDLTRTMTPTMRGVAWVQTHRLAQEGWNARELRLYSHAGTHMDAPRHFLPNGSGVDQLELTKCVGPAWVVDVGRLEAREKITLRHLGEAVERIQTGDRVLLRSGWSRQYGTPLYRDGLPRVSRELAEWFAERGIALLGVEPPSVADVNRPEEVRAIHEILLGAGIVIVEGLCCLELLRAERVFLIALPLKIEDGDGSPCRVVAIEGDLSQLVGTIGTA
ncbi:MAG: cyclase [Candidatus Poribacteria bacterium]|nr:MAG: cyclase [Candidatus Poribacteria bacterium]